jgi:hypothetical protein
LDFLKHRVTSKKGREYLFTLLCGIFFGAVFGGPLKTVIAVAFARRLQNKKIFKIVHDNIQKVVYPSETTLEVSLMFPPHLFWAEVFIPWQ